MIGMTPGSSTVTFSNSSPGIVTWINHGLLVNAPIFFATTGVLPVGLTPATSSTGPQVSPNTYISSPPLYYVKTILSPDAFTVSATQGGTAINTSSAGSGTHTAFANAAVPTGHIGELIYKTVEIGSGVATPSATEVTWVTLPLTPGIWEVSGIYGLYGNSGSPTFTAWHASVGYNVSGGFLTITAPHGGISAGHITTNQSNGFLFPFATQRIFLTANTTISSATTVNYTGGTAVSYGQLRALRVA